MNVIIPADMNVTIPKGWVRVSQAEVSDAYSKFNTKFWPGEVGVGQYFWHFLGMTEAPKYFTYGRPDTIWYLPEDAAHRLRLLAGPYFEPIAKAMVEHGYDPKTAMTRE